MAPRCTAQHLTTCRHSIKLSVSCICQKQQYVSTLVVAWWQVARPLQLHCLSRLNLYHVSAHLPSCQSWQSLTNIKLVTLLSWHHTCEPHQYTGIHGAFPCCLDMHTWTTTIYLNTRSISWSLILVTCVWQTQGKWYRDNCIQVSSAHGPLSWSLCGSLRLATIMLGTTN